MVIHTIGTIQPGEVIFVHAPGIIVPLKSSSFIICVRPWNPLHCTRVPSREEYITPSRRYAYVRRRCFNSISSTESALTDLKRCPSTKITPSKCKLTDWIGCASPGPGWKLRWETDDRAGGWYTGRYNLFSTVTSTKYEPAVYTSEFVRDYIGKTHGTRTWITILDPSGAHSARMFSPCSTNDFCVRARWANTTGG